MSRDSTQMTYWGGASVSGKCACGMTNSVQTPAMVVTVISMTMYGVKTAVSSLTRHVFQLNSSGLGMLVAHPTKITTH